MLYIVQFYAEQHTGMWCESLNKRCSRRLLRDEESAALYKINYYIYKDTEYKYFWMLKYVLRVVHYLFWGRL